MRRVAPAAVEGHLRCAIVPQPTCRGARRYFSCTRVLAIGRFHEPFKRTVGALPATNPFSATGFDPDAVPNEPDEVRGEVGLLTREGGIVTPQQMENARAVMHTRIEEMKLIRVLKVEMRDIGAPVWVQKTSLMALLPPHLQRFYTGAKLGKDQFPVNQVSKGTVLFDLHSRLPGKGTAVLVEILHAGMLQLGIPCVVQGTGIVDVFDDYDSASPYGNGMFDRGEGKVPDGLGLLTSARGAFQVGGAPPKPKNARSMRDPVEWHSEEDRLAAERKVRANTAAFGSSRPLAPSDVFNLSRQDKAWKNHWAKKKSGPNSKGHKVRLTTVAQQGGGVRMRRPK
eukprot:Hpha_TRINITY_DN30712_c0_g1::TRINITY_DN30712_c0_g1_i1::g.28302::m.28302